MESLNRVMNGVINGVRKGSLESCIGDPADFPSARGNGVLGPGVARTKDFSV